MDTFALAAQLGERLKALDRRLAVAESCTGGGICHALTEVPGSSLWLECGMVTYSNASKTALLGVPPAVIERFGAVSSETAAAMAEGAQTAAGVEVSLATTGIAGPGGGTPEKPVGTVWFGWRVSGVTHTERRRFSGDRAEVRRYAVDFALKRLLELLT